MKKLLIFDIDGTVLNTLDTIHYFLNEALKKMDLDYVDLESVRDFVGNGAWMLSEKVIKKIKPTFYTQDDILKLYETYNYLYNANVEYLTRPYEGVVDLIFWAKSQGYIVTAISNKPHKTLSYIMGSVLDEDLFDFYLGQSDDYNKKPDPQMVYELISKYGIDKENAFMIGDSEVDIRTGKNAGIKSIGVSWGFRDIEVLKNEHADYIVSKPEEIKSILEYRDK